MTEEFETHDYEEVKARRHERFTFEERANYEKARAELNKLSEAEESASNLKAEINPAE